LRKIYAIYGITKQRLTHRVGNPEKLETAEEQERQLKILKERVHFFRSRGYHVVQVDECLFSGHRHKGAKHWAPIGRPLQANTRMFKGPSIAVIGAISEEHGILTFAYKDASAEGGVDG